MKLTPAEQALHYGRHTLETPCYCSVGPTAPLTPAPPADALSADVTHLLSTDWPTRSDRKILEAFLAGETHWRLTEGGCLYDGPALRSAAEELCTDFAEGHPSLP